MPLDFKNELKDVNGVEIQISTEQFLIVGHIGRLYIRQSQTGNDN